MEHASVKKTPILNGTTGALVYGSLGGSTGSFPVVKDAPETQAGDDVIEGNAGQDQLYGGAGDDLLDGGTDNDQNLPLSDADVIDTFRAGTEEDRLRSGGGFTFVQPLYLRLAGTAYPAYRLAA